jgi:hypothetical protein
MSRGSINLGCFLIKTDKSPTGWATGVPISGTITNFVTEVIEYSSVQESRLTEAESVDENVLRNHAQQQTCRLAIWGTMNRCLAHASFEFPRSSMCRFAAAFLSSGNGFLLKTFRHIQIQKEACQSIENSIEAYRRAGAMLEVIGLFAGMD